MSREAKGPYLVEASTTHEEFRAKNEIRIAFVKKNSLLAARIVIAYSTIIDNCGGEITSREGFISIPDITDDFDCIWTLRENPGNGVRASVTELRIPYSPNCTDSYLEFRKWNASGPLIGRWCERTPSMFGMEEVIWMKFRYVRPREVISDEDLIKPAMRILFSRAYSCGSVLVPIWDWQEIKNPVPPGQTVGYENNVHCRWTIERPLMTGLRVKIKMLDLEDMGGCPFDFISLLPDRDTAESSGDEFNAGQKYCRSSHVNTTLDYSYNKVQGCDCEECDWLEIRDGPTEHAPLIGRLIL
ncbi:hypothetical protein NECAME_13292 [Necator americanus]|uniref:CUB domain-containing protein n=1 Tax=Necator americanus TaxID=51031 RepID=W2SWW2_NECAM|nr:hypothetical protein NECAME_13292 [Necator americanus]ETN74003.1 hypothetical protein NECAME_13292 [Necator americanus]